MKNLLCDHDTESDSCSIQPIIKRPQSFLTEKQIEEEIFKPDGKCVSCGEEFKVDFSNIKGVVCIRK